MLLKDGKLPQERDCVGCGMPTGHVRYAHVNCEKPKTRKPGWSLDLNPIALLFGFITWRRADGDVRVIGKDLAYNLPVRVCEDCAARLSDRKMVGFLKSIPLYALLLAKFPAAMVSVGGGGKMAGL